MMKKQFFVVVAACVFAVSGLLVTAQAQDASGQVVIPMAGMDVTRELHPNDAHFEIGLAILSNVAETLVRYSTEDASIVPSLATDWEVSDDGTTITFNLREGVTFHNGDTFSAEDVMASWEVLKADEVILGPFSNMLLNTNGADVVMVDEMTVQIVLPEPNPGVFDLLARGLYIGPKGPMLEDIDNIEGSRLQRYPIGTGPYVVVEHETDDIVLEAYPDYWGEPAKIQRIVIQAQADEIGVAAAMRSGEGDIANFDINTMAGLENEPGYTTQSEPSLRGCTLFIKPDFSSPFMAERDVRVAVAHAIDRENIKDTVFGGNAADMAYWRAPGLPLAADVPPIPYDLELANELMIGAGFEKNEDGIWTRDGEVFSLTFANIGPTSSTTDMNILIADNFNEFGIATDFVDYPDTSTYRSVPEDRTEEIYTACTGWTRFVPLDFRFLAVSHEAAERYYLFREGFIPPNNQVELIDQMFQTFDEAEQMELIQQYIEIAQDEMAPFVPLVAPTATIIYKEDIQNVNLTSLPGVTGWMTRMSEWELAE
ncbi:MAG: ABC transporter substrate-binding protein [Chloroflexota bacterium]